VNIRLHIERLVVDAGLADDPRLFEAAVVAELSRAMAAMPPGQAGLLQTGGALDRLQSPMRVLHGPGTAAALGTQVGAAIHAGLAAAGGVASPMQTVSGEMR
jgi:hypothetical protein